MTLQASCAEAEISSKQDCGSVSDQSLRELLRRVLGAVQDGRHTLKATVGQEEVCNSPVSLQVAPGAPCLSASVLDESALTSAAAGQACAMSLRTCNAFGTPLSRGGAPLTAAFGSDGVLSIACFLPIYSGFIWATLILANQRWRLLAGCGRCP